MTEYLRYVWAAAGRTSEEFLVKLWRDFDARFLFDLVRAHRAKPEDMVSVDPPLRTLRNLNTKEDYLAALAEANLPAPLSAIFGH